MTPYLVRRLRVGDALAFDGPYGLYTIPDKLDPAVDCFIYVAAGSGITPNRGIIKTCLGRGLPIRHALFYQNRAPADVIYRTEWEGLAGKIKIVHSISSQGQRLSLQSISDELRGFAEPARSLAFVCGPNRPRDGKPGFVDAFAGVRRKNVVGILGEWGLPFDKIRTELW